MTNNVLVNNLCAWPLYFRRAMGVGDVRIPAGAKKYPVCSFDEALTQIQLGNTLFVGTDGLGAHARLQIIDDEQRKQLFGVEEVSDPPVVLTAESVKTLLAIKSKAKFNDMLAKLVNTDAEKRMLVELAFEAGAENAETWKVDILRELAATAFVNV